MKTRNDSDWDEFKDADLVDWKRVRSSIEHENHLMNHRLTWLLTSQGFLLGGFLLVFQASTGDKIAEASRPFCRYVMAALAGTGIPIAVFLRLSLRAAEQQHDELRQWWDRRKPSHDHPPICGHYPEWYFVFAYSGLPLVFVAGWLVLLLVALWDLLNAHAAGIGWGLLIFVAALALVGIGVILGRRRSPSIK